MAGPDKQPTIDSALGPEAGSVSDARSIEQLQRITDAALSGLDLDELLRKLFDIVAEILHVDTVAMLLLDETSRTLIARAAKGIEEEVRQDVRVPLGQGFAGKIAAERRPVILDDVQHAKVANPLLKQKGIRSLLGVPVIAHDQVVGVMHVGTLRAHKFTTNDVNLLQLVAERAALGMEHLLYEREHHIAETLQRSLLPENLSNIVRIEADARYLPGSVGENVGGDWYDVLPLGVDVGVMIGDVVGRGIKAAAVMGQFRDATRAYAIDGSRPAEIATKLNRLIHHLDPGQMATLFYGLVDPASFEMTFVNAGHLPPLVIDGNGHVSYIQSTPCLPIGTMPDAVYHEESVTLPEGSTLFLYTDGLVERRGESLDVGFDRLAHVLTGEGADLKSICDKAIKSMLSKPVSDDVAILVFRPRVNATKSLRLNPANDASDVAGVRQEILKWLDEIGAGAEETYDINLAAVEACTNVVLHAYGSERSSFHVSADVIEGDKVLIEVRDSGKWREPQPGQERGFGLLIMRALMDEVELDRRSGGTKVRLKKKLKSHLK